MKRKIIVIGIVVLVFAGIAYKLAANKKIIDSSKKVENKEVVIPVTAISAQFKEVSDNLIKSGTLIPYKEADITSVSSGKLTSVHFELGDYVSRGTVLATVDNSGLELNLEAAQLAMDKAQKDYERSKALLAGNATTTMNFQDAQYNYENSKNKIDQIKKQIADNQIKAPVSGQIVSKTKEVGEYVSPGTILGHIVEVNRLKVDVMVGEQEVYSLKKGAPVAVTTDVYPGVSFNGKIIFISQKGDDVHNYQVEVALNNKKEHHLMAGSFANVDFNRKSEQNLMLIPKSALIQSLDKPMVYIIENGKAKIRDITPGGTYGNDLAVAKGLQPGEKIITSGLVNISEGTPVKIVNVGGEK